MRAKIGRSSRSSHSTKGTDKTHGRRSFVEKHGNGHSLREVSHVSKARKYGEQELRLLMNTTLTEKIENVQEKRVPKGYYFHGDVQIADKVNSVTGAVRHWFLDRIKEGGDIALLVKDNQPLEGELMTAGLDFAGIRQKATMPTTLALIKNAKELMDIDIGVIGSADMSRAGISGAASHIPNYLNRGRCPGGSSNGSAIACSYGVNALGNDIGGSVRIPAEYFALWGHKPNGSNEEIIQMILNNPDVSISDEQRLAIHNKFLKKDPVKGLVSHGFFGKEFNDLVIQHALSHGQCPSEFRAQFDNFRDKKVRIGVLSHTPTTNTDLIDKNEFAQPVEDIVQRLQDSGFNAEFVKVDPKDLQIVSSEDLARSFVQILCKRSNKRMVDFQEATGLGPEAFYTDKETGGLRQCLARLGQKTKTDSLEQADTNLELARYALNEVMGKEQIDFIISPTVGTKAAEDILPGEQLQSRFKKLAEIGRADEILNELVGYYHGRENLSTMWGNITSADIVCFPNMNVTKGHTPRGVSIMTPNPTDVAHLMSLSNDINQTLGIDRGIKEFYKERHVYLLEQAKRVAREEESLNIKSSLQYSIDNPGVSRKIDESQDVFVQLAKRDEQALKDGKLVVASMPPIPDKDLLQAYADLGWKKVKKEWSDWHTHFYVLGMKKDGRIDGTFGYNSPDEQPELYCPGPSDPTWIEGMWITDYWKNKPNLVAGRDISAVIDPDKRRLHGTSSIILEGLELEKFFAALDEYRRENRKNLGTDKTVRYYVENLTDDAIKEFKAGEAIIGNCQTATLDMFAKAYPRVKLPLPPGVKVSPIHKILGTDRLFEEFYESKDMGRGC